MEYTAATAVQKWRSLETFEEREAFHSELESDDAVKMPVFNAVDVLYWEEHHVREKLMEEGRCPDCLAFVKTTNEHTPEEPIYSFSCKC